MSGPPVPDDDRLHAMDSVHADDFGVRHHCKLTVRCLGPSPQVASKPSCCSRVGCAQHEEHPLAAADSVDDRSECVAAVAGYDEINRPLRTLHRFILESWARGGERRDVFDDSDPHS